MASKKEGTLYLLVLISTPFIVYYILADDLPGYDGYSIRTLGICFVSLLSAFAMAYLIYTLEKKYFSKSIDFEDIGKEPKPSKKHSKKSRTLDIFGGKNRCDTCGTEMEYKKNIERYYCPVCHEYK